MPILSKHYREWLSPQTQLETWTFNTTLNVLTRRGLLATARPKGDLPYRPTGSTALYWAINTLLSDRPHDGRQAVFVLYTDGEDTEQGSLESASALLHRVQEQEGWLCLFLGAFPGALVLGRELGFTEGNCLLCNPQHIATDFARLCSGLRTYLLATPAQQKLLAAHGVFAS